MSRLDFPKPFCRRVQGLLSYLRRDDHPPTASELIKFAGQFSREEWRRLCEDRSFLAVVDRDLTEAGAVASVLLERTVFI